MSKIYLNIDGREVSGFEGQTILEIARENGVDIPTLCHDERVEMYGSCGLCTVELEGSPKLLRSCSTYAADGMIIHTKTKRVMDNRRAALELLLSDHTGDCRPPCMLACPAGTDCQGYVGLIANGEYKEAVKLIKDKIPLPASIGRVCPHPCEKACRRQLVEEPVSIAALKQFAGDLDLANGELYTPVPENPTGKSVAIIGGGPGGLSAAYFLRLQGHDVTIYDAMPEMGGMLRYGIPEYRLPKSLLSKEIEAIEKIGVKFNNNIKIGVDLTLEYLRDKYQAVVIAIGAWSSTGLRCPGETLDGVIGGIDFLRKVSLGSQVLTGRRIAVVGGGNTAMDACRTAVRLGASEVYNIYRRTKNEMPAEQIEIAEAEEEGVIFKNLTNPIQVIGENGKVKALQLQIMELGEPDASGRRAPVPVEGSEEILEVDTVIVAIGQKPALDGFESVEQTKWRTLYADEHTFRTNLDGVFAVGDVSNKGADIAISAIGEARKAVDMICRYLDGEQLSYEEPFLVKSEKTQEDFKDKTKEPRVRIPHRSAEERRRDFLEVNKGLSEEDARREASRCLECGCHDYFECRLINYANQYHVKPEKYEGKTHHRAKEDDHPFIHRNPDKCILCGLCVRICDEVVGATALGLVGRGFNTIVKPALEAPLQFTDCIACGQCVSVCPTGALTETMMIPKQVPLIEETTETICSFCSVGCKTRLTSKGNLLLRNLPAAEKDALLCIKGRFGFGEIAKRDRLTTPIIRRAEKEDFASYEQAYVYTNKGIQGLQARYGDDCVAVAVSDRYTNEEAFLIREYANKALRTNNVFSFGQTSGGIEDVLGSSSSTATFNELEHTELIIAVMPEKWMMEHGVVGMKIKRAVKHGAKLLLISDGDNLLDSIAFMKLSTCNDLSVLKQIAGAIIKNGFGKELGGYDSLKVSLGELSDNSETKAAADAIVNAKKAIFVYDKNILTRQAQSLVADIALLSGHSFGSRNGILQLLPGANSMGLLKLGIRSGEKLTQKISDGSIRGLIVFGEDAENIKRGELEFLAVQDLHMTATAALADIVFPASSFAECSGSYTSADGKVQSLKPAVQFPDGVRDNITQLLELSANAGAVLPYRNIEDVQNAMSLDYTSSDEAPKLIAVEDGALYRDNYTCTNELARMLMKPLDEVR